MSLWVNIDEHLGVPSQPRRDVAPPPHWRLDAIAALGRPHHPAVSMDGTRVAFVLDAGDASDIRVMNADGTDLRRLTTDREPHAFWEDTAPAWSPAGDQIAYVAGGWVYMVASAGGPSIRLTEGGSPLWLDEQHLVITVERDGVDRLCRLEVGDPWPVALTPPDGSAGSAVLSPDRRRIAYLHDPRDDCHRRDVRVVDLSDASVRTVVSTPGCFLGAPAYSPDGERLVFASERSGWSELHVLEGGGERSLTVDGADFSFPRWDRDGRSILAVRTREGVGDLVRVDTDGGEVTVLAAGGTWSSPFRVAGGRVVALQEDHRTPPRIMSVASDGSARTIFSEVPAAVATAPHITPTVVSYPSFDGLAIPGFLFRPPAADLGRCPVVVFPHGGPTSHYGDEWDGHAQFFLDKGYGWFAINFRGSTGYGVEFEHAGHGGWGVADAGDCLAAYDYLAGLDWVDPERVAIFGSSYGSYLAVASLARDPQHRFACGVAKYGDSDILTSWAQGDRGGAQDLERTMGHPSGNRDGYRGGSPVHRVAGIERPLLVVHGEKDERVHPLQSRQLVDALRAHGKTFEYVTYPTEGHGLLRRGPHLHFYRRLERFLDWYLM